MKNFFTHAALAALLSMAISIGAQAEEIQLREDHPNEYIVVKGDTLWDISESFLKNPWLWPEIWHANPQINNPHLIFPGDVISLIYLDGQPRLTINRRGGKLQPGVTKLSPAVRVVPLGDAIPAIPLDIIDAFLNRNRVVDEEEFEAAPYVVAGQQKRLISAAGDRIYARGPLIENIPNYNIYRLGKPYVDPVSKEVLGFEALSIGGVRLAAKSPEVSTMKVLRTSEEVRIGDRLLPSEERSIDSTFFPSAPDNENIEGVVVALDQGLTHAGSMDVVVVNLGERDDVESGDVLAIYKAGAVIKDRIGGGKVQLPEEKVGLVMIFRTFDKLSYALILEAEESISVRDKLYSPSRPL